MSGNSLELARSGASLGYTKLPPGIVAKSPAFLAILDQVRRLANFDVTVLIEGETGVGKELVVRFLHYQSGTARKPFVPVNVGAIPDNLFENELFGHAAGAYTGARGASEGLVALAEGGTLFLDEIDALSMHAQAALLRFLQDFSYRPVGSSNLKQANIRVVTATNSDPLDLMQRGLLRKDLYFRLCSMHVKIPPLRERKEDVEPLAEFFLAEFNSNHAKHKHLGPAMRQWLATQQWPGNVRELRSVIERSFILSPQAELLPPAAPAATAAVSDPTQNFRQAKAQAIRQFEQHFLQGLLQEHGGNVSQAARATGKERKSLDRLLHKHGINRADYCTMQKNLPKSAS